MNKYYRVLNEYIDYWYWGMDSETIEKIQSEGITLKEIKILAIGWNKTTKELLDQCVRIN